MIERLERFEPSLLVESRDKPALVDASHERGIDQRIRVDLFRLRILVGKNFQAALDYFERRIGLLFQNTEGIYIFKTNKPKSLAVMKKHLLGASDEVLEETYRYTSNESLQKIIDQVRFHAKSRRWRFAWTCKRREFVMPV